jgi:diguanylate cyclase (GGDEF)-like protein/PAS domain S-box-containing protein
MMLDIKTLMFLYFIINLVGFGAIALVWNRNRKRFAGLAFWLADMALQATGSVLILLRGLIPDFVSMVVANTMVLTGIVLLLIGLERFVGEKSRQRHNYVLLAIFASISTYFSVIQPNLTVRDIAGTAMIVIFTFQCCWLLLWRIPSGMRRITSITGIIFGSYVVINFARIIGTIVYPAQSNDYFKAGLIDALALVLYITLSACLTISLILMVNRRLMGEVQTQEEKFTKAFHSAPYAVILTRASDGKIFEVNDSFVTITGYQYTEVIEKTTLDLHLWVREEDRLAVVNQLSKGNKVQGAEFQFRNKSGGSITGLFSADLIMIDSQKCIQSTISDITDRKESEYELKLRALILDNSSELVYVHEPFPIDRLLYVNDMTCTKLGYNRDELLTMKLSDILDGDLKGPRRRQEMGNPLVINFETVLRCKNGSSIPVESQVTHTEKGGKVLLISSARDITERKRLEKGLEKAGNELIEMASHDFLTGLPNRRLLFDRFAIALANAQRKKKGLALMSLDLDKFKAVNDIYGHDAGDKLLVAAAGRLTGILRKVDTVARMGGDEFILLLWDVDHKEAAVKVAQKVIEEFRRPFLIDGHTLNNTVSLGVAIYPEDGKDIEDLLKNSDKSLYLVKESGRDNYQFST